MSHPFNRGSSPGRAREAWERTGSFKSGHKKLGGRKKGTRNLISPEQKRVLLEAAHRVGSDGNGEGGAHGYFTWVAKRYPTFFFVDLWARMPALECHQHAKGAEVPCIRIDGEMRRRLRESPNAEVQDLMRLAIERPKVFSKLFYAAHLTPPKGWRARARRSGLLCDA